MALRLLLAFVLTLAAGGLLLPDSPAYAAGQKSSQKKSGKKSGKRGKKSGKRGKKKARKSRRKSAKKKASKSAKPAATPAATPAAAGPAAAGQSPTPPPPAAVKQAGADAGKGGPASGQGNVAQNADGDGGADADADASDETVSAEGTADVDSLRQEYLALRDELFRSRARAATVASAMYSTRLQINLTYGSARFYTVTRTVIRLDGASVFDDASGAIANDQATRFEGFVAPGRHVVTVRIEATGKDDERFTTAVENTFTIQAPGGKDVTVTVKAKDDGDMAYAWEKKQRGSYQPSLSIAVTTTPRAGKKSGKKKAEKKARSRSVTRTAEVSDAR